MDRETSLRGPSRIFQFETAPDGDTARYFLNPNTFSLFSGLI